MKKIRPGVYYDEATDELNIDAVETLEYLGIPVTDEAQAILSRLLGELVEESGEFEEGFAVIHDDPDDGG